MWSHLLWAIGMAISVVACARIAPGSTPVDRDLPLVAALVTTTAWLVRTSRFSAAILCAVPLLVACVIAFPDDGQRLLAYGIVVATAYCGAILAAARPTPGQLSFPTAAAFVVIGVALLRWVAREGIDPGREVVVLLGAVAIVAVMPRRSALTVALALLAVLVTPAIPARTVAIPFIVAMVAWLVRVRVTVAPLFVTFITVMLFPWSGVVARAVPYYFRQQPPRERIVLAYAIPPGRHIDLDVPREMRSLVLSVANCAHLPRGTEVGSLSGRVIRMGEVADWGASRREVWWQAKVTVPEASVGRVRGYGYDAWVDGAARFELGSLRKVRVTTVPNLPADACIQVEALER